MMLHWLTNIHAQCPIVHLDFNIRSQFYRNTCSIIIVMYKYSKGPFLHFQHENITGFMIQNLQYMYSLPSALGARNPVVCL